MFLEPSERLGRGEGTARGTRLVVEASKGLLEVCRIGLCRHKGPHQLGWGCRYLFQCGRAALCFPAVGKNGRYRPPRLIAEEASAALLFISTPGIKKTSL